MFSYEKTDKAIFAMQCATTIVSSNLQGADQHRYYLDEMITSLANQILKWLEEHENIVP